MNLFFKPYQLYGMLMVFFISLTIAYLAGFSKASSARNFPVQGFSRPDVSGTKKASERVNNNYNNTTVGQTSNVKSYGPKIDPIIQESNRAMSEMGRLYMSIKDPEIKQKINEIMRITDKIARDAIDDPDDIPQIKKFFNYYLPTTIKLLNAYDRMASQDIQGETIGKSMDNINKMLDTAIEAYKKRLDSLFDNQALDIETDIDVMNQMLEREGLLNDKELHRYSAGAAAQATQKGL